MSTSYATEAGAPPRPDGAKDEGIGRLIGEVAGDLSRLFRQEVELAKVEIRAEATKAGRAAGLLGGAGVAGLLAAVMLSLAIAAALAEVMHPTWAALIVAAAWVVVGAALYFAGRRGLQAVSPVPRQTVETIKEDVQWLRKPTG